MYWNNSIEKEQFEENKIKWFLGFFQGPFFHSKKFSYLRFLNNDRKICTRAVFPPEKIWLFN